MKFRMTAAALALLLGLISPLSMAWAAEESALPADLPALSRQWHGTDYEVVVGKIARGEMPLPRLSSPESAELFARLVSEDNLDLQKNKSLPVTARMSDFTTMAGAHGQLLMLYLREKPQDVSGELAALMSYMLRVSASGADMMSELLPVIPRDEQFDARMQALDKFKSGMADVLVGSELAAADPIMSASQKSQLFDAMARSIDAVKPYLAPDVKRELLGKLSKHRATATAADAPALDRLLQSLQP